MTTADVYRALWRYRLAIVGVTIGAAVAAFFVVSRQQSVYEASTLVRIQQQITDPSQSLGALATGQKLAQTYADIVETSTVAASIAASSDGHLQLADVAGHVHGSPVQDLDLLWIRVRSPSPAFAARAANAAPAALRRFIHRTGTLHEHVITAQRASVPSAPIEPRVMRSVVLVFVTFLLLNCGLALVIHTLRDPVGTSEQLHQVTSLPLLGTVPRLQLDPAPRARSPVLPPITERANAS
jgi:receptor protein-tyrosine kinase